MIRKMTAFTCAVLASLAAGSSAQAADYRITLDRSFLERAIEDAVNQTIIAREHRMYWGHVSGRRVEVSRKNASTISIDLDLAFSAPSAIPNPEVDVNIDVGFSCYYAHPDINLSVPYIDVDVDFPWYVDVLTGGVSLVISTAVNAVIDNQAATVEEIKQKVLAKVNDQIGQVVFDFCPSFNVTSGANVEVTFGLGNECTPGAERHERCPFRHIGNGYDYDCINGYWEQTGGFCEPVGPDGRPL